MKPSCDKGRGAGPQGRGGKAPELAAAEQRWADTMGEAHPPTVLERLRQNRAATKAVGAGPQGRGGEAPELKTTHLTQPSLVAASHPRSILSR
jgi:hypothetical protein